MFRSMYPKRGLEEASLGTWDWPSITAADLPSGDASRRDIFDPVGAIAIGLLAPTPEAELAGVRI
jgi:hypothetical protein